MLSIKQEKADFVKQIINGKSNDMNTTSKKFATGGNIPVFEYTNGLEKPKLRRRETTYNEFIKKAFIK